MTAEFVVYIDESGDEGFRFLDEEKGSSRWFVLSAAVFRKTNDHFAVSIMREARELLKKPPKKALHFRDLKHEHRVPFVKLIAANSTIRTVTVFVYKPAIPNPEKFSRNGHMLYRYVTRLLLERVSWLCRDARNPDGNCSADLIFSNRSAMSYDEIRNYFGMLQEQATKGGDVQIDWNVIDKSRVKAINHDQLAGLQIADAVASSAFFAVNKNPYGEVEPRYFQELKHRMYRHRGNVLGYGMKLWCANEEDTKQLTHLANRSDPGFEDPTH